MPVNLSGSAGLRIQVKDARTAISGAASESGERNMGLDVAYQIVSGTAAGQVDRCWSNTATVADGGTVTVDLAGVMTDAFGAAVVLVKLRGIWLYAATTNTTTLSLARPAATGSTLFAAASDALAGVSAGGFVCWFDPAAGVAAAAGSTDLISIINSAGAIATYTVGVIGTSV